MRFNNFEKLQEIHINDFISQKQGIVEWWDPRNDKKKPMKTQTVQDGKEWMGIHQVAWDQLQKERSLETQSSTALPLIQHSRSN